MRSIISKNRDVVINILSIISYCIIFFNWNLLEKINPPTNIRMIIVSEVVHIDFIGALIPFIISSIFSYYMLHNKIISLLTYINNLSIITAIIFLSKSFLSPNSGAIIVQWLFISLLSSFMSTLSLYSRDEIKEKPIPYSITIRIFIIGYCYSTFSILLTDIIHTVFSTYSYIGAAGLVDAIFLSSVFVIIPAFFWVSLFNILRARASSREG